MSESDRSQSTSPEVKSPHLSHGKEPDKKHGSDSDKSSYSEKFYSDDESSSKFQMRKKHLNGGRTRGNRGNRGSLHKSRHGMISRGSGGGGGGEGSVAARHVLSANRLKVNDLRNKVAELVTQLLDLQEENKDIRRQLRKRERCLEQYEQQENDMPTLLQRQSQESHAFREQLRRQKKLLEEKEKKLKTTQDELQRTQRLLKKMKELVDDKQLAERDELNNKLMQAEVNLKEREVACKKLEDHIEHLKKNHKHELGIERARQKETNHKLTELQMELERIQKLLKEKERELGVCNIRANRQVKPPNRVSSCTSTSPSSDILPPYRAQHVKPARNSGPNRKGSVGSMDLVMDDKKQQVKKVSLNNIEKELNKDQELERRQQFQREREMERQREMERESKLEKEITTEAANRQKKEVATAEEKRKKEEELKNAKLQKGDQKDKGILYKQERRNNKDEEVNMMLEKDFHDLSRKEERDRCARELEAERQAQNLEEKERLKQKAMLLAKMRDIDEQKLMNDKEFFLKTPPQNEFLPRERQMMMMNDENIPAFGDYRPSFLTGSASSKSNRNGIIANSKVGKAVKSKNTVVDELFGIDGDKSSDH